MARVALIGDVGGQARCLHQALHNLGADLANRLLPADLTVVQVGDVVGGTDEDLPLLESLMEWQERNPGRWVQLIGNWEARHLGGIEFGVRKASRGRELPAAGVALLQQLNRTGRLAWTAVVATAAGNQVLVTHAGLTADWWAYHADHVADPVAVARRITALANAGSNVVHTAREMLGDESVFVGPLWASCWEVYRSWVIEGALPFGQVHGHSCGFRWPNRSTMPGCWWEADPLIVEHLTAKVDRRHVWFELDGRRIVGIDCALWRGSRSGDLHPLVLSGKLAFVGATAA